MLLTLYFLNKIGEKGLLYSFRAVPYGEYRRIHSF